jgi:hypothetical protein
MKRVEHLKDRFGRVLFDGYAGAKGPSVRCCVEDNRREISEWEALIQCFANLAHHRNVKDVERRARESDSRDPLVDPKPDVLKFFRHLM